MAAAADKTILRSKKPDAQQRRNQTSSAAFATESEETDEEKMSSTKSLDTIGGHNRTPVRSGIRSGRYNKPQLSKSMISSPYNFHHLAHVGTGEAFVAPNVVDPTIVKIIDSAGIDLSPRSENVNANRPTPASRPSKLGAEQQSRAEQTWLISGECVVVDEPKFSYASPCGDLTGHAFVTNYRIRFESSFAPQGELKRLVVDIPLGAISSVEKVGRSNFGATGIKIDCKDMRTIRFNSLAAGHSRRSFYEHVKKHAFPATNNLAVFAFDSMEKFTYDGWSLYQAEREYERLQISNGKWELKNINAGYTFADTYPKLIAVPKAAGVNGYEFLESVGKFRSRNRIPVLSWKHPGSQATITRSSQPLIGVTNRASADDASYLRMIMRTNPIAKKLLIYDARPHINATANRGRGGGYEDTDERYPDSRLIFLNIPKIQIIRESWQKLKKLCQDDASSDLSEQFNKLDWLVHIQKILDAAFEIAHAVQFQHHSVLVHCSDGWDRTPQLTSLAMLLLDPYYRTISGFAVLIEKEWCSFGHQFALRIGHGENNPSDDQRSPIFQQFIDCVWQILQQHPAGFEFNEQLLITILNELYACRFGTFLCNSEKERRDQGIKERTQSLWSYIEANRPVYTEHESNTIGGALISEQRMQRCRLWWNYYCRHITKQDPAARRCPVGSQAVNS